MRFLPFKVAATVALTVLVASGASAQFTAGNLVVSRVGTGSAALTNAATASFLDQYTIGGTFVNTTALPTAVNGNNRRLTNSGTATSEGFLSRSQNGQYLTYAGYDADAGTAGVVGTASTAVNRVIARVDAAGTVDTTTALTDAFSANNIRSAATADGTSFFAAGANTGIVNAGFGATTSTIVSTTLTNNRVTNIFNNTLYFSTASGANRGIYSLGTPSGAANQTAVLIANTGATSSSYDFAFNAAGTVLYVADDAAGIRRFNFNSATNVFDLAYVVNATTVRGLTVDFTGTDAVLYATASTGTSVIRVADTGAGSASTTLFTAAANTAFRDVVFSPFSSGAATPEPGTLALLGVGAVPGIGLLAARRRRAQKAA